MSRTSVNKELVHHWPNGKPQIVSIVFPAKVTSSDTFVLDGVTYEPKLSGASSPNYYPRDDSPDTCVFAAAEAVNANAATFGTHHDQKMPASSAYAIAQGRTLLLVGRVPGDAFAVTGAGSTVVATESASSVPISSFYSAEPESVGDEETLTLAGDTKGQLYMILDTLTHRNLGTYSVQLALERVSGTVASGRSVDVVWAWNESAAESEANYGEFAQRETYDIPSGSSFSRLASFGPLPRTQRYLHVWLDTSGGAIAPAEVYAQLKVMEVSVQVPSNTKLARETTLEAMRVLLAAGNVGGGFGPADPVLASSDTGTLVASTEGQFMQVIDTQSLDPNLGMFSIEAEFIENTSLFATLGATADVMWAWSQDDLVTDVDRTEDQLRLHAHSKTIDLAQVSETGASLVVGPIPHLARYLYVWVDARGSFGSASFYANILVYNVSSAVPNPQSALPAITETPLSVLVLDEQAASATGSIHLFDPRRSKYWVYIETAGTADLTLQLEVKLGSTADWWKLHEQAYATDGRQAILEFDLPISAFRANVTWTAGNVSVLVASKR